MEKAKFKITNLKSEKTYMNELKEIHKELGVGIVTDTLIESDLKLLTRIDEIVIILDWLKNKKKEIEYE